MKLFACGLIVLVMFMLMVVSNAISSASRYRRDLHYCEVELEDIEKYLTPEARRGRVDEMEALRKLCAGLRAMVELEKR